jgi:hypothetical protein
MDCCQGQAHQENRQLLNDWDDVTVCTRCNAWLQVHPDVRSKNPNFPKIKRGNV